MKIHALKFRQTDGDKLHIVDGDFQALYSSDAQLLHSLSQSFLRIVSSGKILAQPMPLTAIAEMPGRGALSALLVTAPDTLQKSVPSVFLGNAAPEPVNADLALISMAEMLESGSDYSRIALELAAFTDTGNCHQGLIEALANLEAFTQTIGRGSAADTALGRAQKRLEQLKTERATLKVALKQAAKYAPMLHEKRDYVMLCRARRTDIETAWCAAVVVQGRQIHEQLQDIERQLGESSARLRLDSEQAAAIQRAETLFETACLQLERTREELHAVETERDALPEDSDTEAMATTQSLKAMKVLQAKIQNGQGRFTEFNARLDEINNQVGALDTHIADAQHQLAGLPDFSRIAPNPIDWLNQLARSFKTALTMRDNEEEARDAMRAERADLRVEIAGDAAIFENSGNFAEALIVHQNKKKQWENRSTQIEDTVCHHRNLRDELADSIPGQFILSFGCILFLLLLLGAYLGSQKTPILYPCIFLLAATLFFLANLIVTRHRVTRLTRSIAEGQAELDLMSEASKGEVSQVDRLMTRADCRTARELEARYDRYRELRTRLDALETGLAQQEEHLRESEERIPMLFERVRSTLEQVDEIPRNEEDIDGAVGRAIAKYQVYRETKRRLADLRNQHQGLLSRKRFLERELAAARNGLPEAEHQLRALMREHGFEEEAEYIDVNGALAAFYHFLELQEKNMGRRGVLLRTQQALEARLAEEEAVMQKHKNAFDALLEQAGFDTPEQAHSAADNTMALHALERDKEALEQQCEALLQGHPLAHWRKLAGDTALDEVPDIDQCVRELQALEKENQEALRKYQALKQEQQELLAPHRLLNEIEEDMAAEEKRMEVLRNDVAAAAHAIALVEETLNTWRVQYGEKIAERASALLEILGIVAVLQLKLDPNDVPAIEVLTENNEAISPALVNMALRLAAMDLLTDAHTPRPLIVDIALEDTPLPVPAEKIIDVFAECAKKRQVLLLFDSESLATAAAKKHLPLLKF